MTGLVFDHAADVADMAVGHQRQAVAALMALAANPVSPAGYAVSLWQRRPHTVGLEGLDGMLCLRFGPDGEYRLVYRLVEQGAEVIAIGRRFKSEVYVKAAERLSPPRPPRRVRPSLQGVAATGRRREAT